MIIDMIKSFFIRLAVRNRKTAHLHYAPHYPSANKVFREKFRETFSLIGFGVSIKRKKNFAY